MRKLLSTAALITGGALLLSGCATTGTGTDFAGHSHFDGVTFGDLANPGDCATTPGICGKMNDAARPFTRNGPDTPR